MNWSLVWEHLFIVVVSTLITIVLGVPLGVLAYFQKSFRKLILFLVDILQTIPALALLGMIMVLLGAGKPTVIIGLVLYSLLPVVYNTCLGLTEINPAIKEAAIGMGMTRIYRLVHIEFPLAIPTIFTGIRIAAVTAVGVAVFATFVGGGGLGGVIYRGIHIQNMRLILYATLSLMVMSIVIDMLMSLAEKSLLRRKTNF
ncbi:ABC transporter permease [Neisseria sp. Ec49-e6-T10]|uniref:ABC transporter permease n=1 Tax=Neisseria sp. Ec49-e6-T10 TaxID=3140744 RepID=UPI003EBD1E59